MSSWSHGRFGLWESSHLTNQFCGDVQSGSVGRESIKNTLTQWVSPGSLNLQLSWMNNWKLENMKLLCWKADCLLLFGGVWSLRFKILKYSSLMLCMYAPVSIKRCLACVFSVFRVKKKENGSCYSHFWRWGEIQTSVLLPLLCCFFYPQCTEHIGAWPPLHQPLRLSHLSQKQSLEGGCGI